MVETYLMRDERPGSPPYFIQAKVNSISGWLPVVISNNKKYCYLTDAIEEIKLFIDRWQSDFEYQVVDKVGEVRFWKHKEVEIDLGNDDFYGEK